MAKKVTAKLYDGKTPFNNVPVDKINAAWGNEPHVLIYVDGVFSGQACELGNWTLKQWQQYFHLQLSIYYHCIYFHFVSNNI